MADTAQQQAETPDDWEWITLTEAARRVVELGLADRMTRQRISTLAAADPSWPAPREQWRPVGAYKLLPWEPVKEYFETRDASLGHKGWTAQNPGVTVVIDRAGREGGTARFSCAGDPRLNGVSHRLADSEYSVETDETDGQESIYAEASSRQAAIRKIAKQFGVRVKEVSFT